MIKTITIEGTEYETETHDFGKKLSDIKIPKGWRLWTADECIKLHNNYRQQCNLEYCFFFIKQPFISNAASKYVAGFGANSDWANLYCSRNPSNTYAALGVRFARDVKKVKT